MDTKTNLNLNDPSDSFTKSCIPKTLRLAYEFQDYIQKIIYNVKFPDDWPLGDKVFALVFENF
jgi:hypothetical protein